MRILRPALLGLLIAFLAVGGLILFPERTEDSVRQELPPKLFPIFPREKEERRERRERSPMEKPLVRVTKAPLLREVATGSSFVSSVTVESIAEARLYDLLVEERFDASLFSVSDVQDGMVEKNVVRWTIAKLQPEEQWSRNYTVTLSPDLSPRTIEMTLTVVGDDLRGTPTASRAATSVLTVIPLPRTGVQLPSILRWLLQIAL